MLHVGDAAGFTRPVAGVSSCCAACADPQRAPAPCPGATTAKLSRAPAALVAPAPAATPRRPAPRGGLRPSQVPVSRPSDREEHEADRLAAAAVGPGAGAHAVRGAAAAGDEPVDADAAHAAVAVARRAATPLPRAVREDLEDRLGRSVDHVRLNVGSEAGPAARSVGARAYTYGTGIVVDPAELAPDTAAGRLLLAHEAVHALQQGPAGAALQRACLPAATCAAKRSTLTTFVQETEADKTNKAKRARRTTACARGAAAPGCMTDGHGAPATSLTAIMRAKYPSRLAAITGIFVDKDMPPTWGAYTNACSSFTPPLPGGSCTFVPDQLEAEAKQYRSGATTVGGVAASQWLVDTVGTLTHETGHALFDATAIPEPSATACHFADLKDNLSEMAAHLSEMHVYYRAALAKPQAHRFDEFNAKFDFWVNNGSEDIAGIVKDLRCRCECADADYYIKKTVEQVSTAQKWDTNEAFTIHTQLRDPKWGLTWPITPGAVTVTDLPTVSPQPLRFE